MSLFFFIFDIMFQNNIKIFYRIYWISMTHSLINMHMTLKFIYFAILFLSGAINSIKYPVTLGGITSGLYTDIQKFDFDASMNLAIVAKSNDQSLVDGTGDKYIVLYHEASGDQFLWSKQLLFTTNPTKLVSVEVGDNWILLVFDPITILTISKTDGALSSSNKFVDATSSPMMSSTDGCFATIFDPSSINYQLIGTESSGSVVFITNVLSTMSRFRSSTLTNRKITGMINAYPTNSYVFVALKYKGSCGSGISGCSELLTINVGSTSYSLKWAVKFSLDSKITLMSYEPDPALPTNHYLNALIQTTNNEQVILFRQNSTSINTMNYAQTWFFTKAFPGATSEVRFHHMVMISKEVIRVLCETSSSTLEILDITTKSTTGSGGVVVWTLQTTKSAYLSFAFFYQEDIFFLAGKMNSVKKLAAETFSLNDKMSFISQETPSSIEQIMKSAQQSIKPYVFVTGDTFTVTFTKDTNAVSKTSPVLTTTQYIDVKNPGKIDSNANCLIETDTATTSPLQTATYLINAGIQSYTSPPATAPSLLFCTTGSFCSEYKYFILNRTSDAATIKIAEITGGFSLESTNTVLNNKVFTIVYKGAKTETNLFPTVCQFYTLHMNVKFRRPTITTAAISDITYTIGDLVKTAVLSSFSKGFTDPEYVSNPDFDITYHLEAPLKTTYTPSSTQLITSLSGTTITIQELNPQNEGKKTFNLVAQFANYDPSYSASTTFNINVVDLCSGGTLTQSTIPDIYYQVGTSAVTATFSDWTYISKLSSSCGSMAYTYEIVSGSKSPTLSFLTFTGTTKTIKVETSTHTDNGLYTVAVRGIQSKDYPGYGLKIYSSTTKQFKIRVLSTMLTTITAVSVPQIIYTVTDQKLKVNFNSFLSSDSSIDIKYELVMMPNQNPYDPNVFEFDSTNRFIAVKQLKDNKYAGQYLLEVRGRFNLPIAQTYYQSSSAFVTLKHSCTKNLINAAQIPEKLYYEITDPALSKTLPNWSMNMSATDCGPIKYSATLASGQSLPSFIKFDARTQILKIQASSPSDEKEYQIKISGSTDFFSELSQISKQTILTVNCTAKKLTPKEQIKKQFKDMSNPESLKVVFSDFQIFPKCQTQQKIEYTSTLESGGALPSFIVFDSGLKQYMIASEPNVSQQTLKIALKGQVAEKVVDTLVWELQIEIGSNKQQSSQIIEDFSTTANIQLSPIVLNLTVGNKTIWEPEEMKQLAESEIKIINTGTPAQNFAVIKNQKLELLPKPSDSGMSYKIALTATNIDKQTGKQLKIMQPITLSVQKYQGQDNKVKEVTAKIISISQTGKVHIEFNQMLKTGNDSTVIRQALQLQILDDSRSSMRNLTYNWTVTKFKEQTLEIQIEFENPIFVSQGVRLQRLTNGIQDYDYLEIKIINNMHFVSMETGLQILSRYTMYKKIPRQMDNSGIFLTLNSVLDGSRYIDSLTKTVKQGMENFMQSSSVASAILQDLFKNMENRAFGLNRVWGSMSSIQLFLSFPFVSLEMPANVQLFYYMINYNFQFQIFNFDFLQFQDIISFDQQESNHTLRMLQNSDQVQSIDSGFSNQFEDSDIFQDQNSFMFSNFSLTFWFVDITLQIHINN